MEGDIMKKDCDHKYFPTGPALYDILDFMRNEQLWLKTFLKAWHIATENGLNLSYLDAENGPKRDDPTPEEQVDCLSKGYGWGRKCNNFGPECDTAIIKVHQGIM